MKNKITSFILTDFGWFKFWLTNIFKITLLASSPDLSESIYVVEIRLSHTPLDPANAVNFFPFRRWTNTMLIAKVTFGMFELTAPYNSIVVRMVVMERVTRAGTAERLIQKQHQLRMTRTTAGM